MAEYCLRWNNHQPNLVTVFSELLNSEALVDVTLASDGQAIQAHRLVLSACSAYFKELFGLNPCAHPIVFLKDIHYEDLKTVIDFIYKGEVNVSQDRLQDVLKTAELLRIKGLADKPFSYDEYSSQSREQRLSSSFSTQRSSLADSKDHVVNTEAEDGIEPRSSPRPSKRRKIASQDSSESQQDSGHDSEDRTRALESKDDRVNLVTIDEDKLKDEPTEPKGSSSIKEEKDTPDRNSDQQESGAVDAMLLLHGSSSETESTIPVGQGASTQSGNNGRENTSLFGSHSQGSLDWSLSLGHWWASVLPALAQHHQHQSGQSTSLSHAAISSLHHPHYRYLPRSQRPHPAGSTSGSNSLMSTIQLKDPAMTPATSSRLGNTSSSTSREGSPAGGGTSSHLVVGPLDQLALVSALGKEVSPQMVQALQAVASKRESFSSAAKLYSVSVTTLWRYFKKLGISDHNTK